MELAGWLAELAELLGTGHWKLSLGGRCVKSRESDVRMEAGFDLASTLHPRLMVGAYPLSLCRSNLSSGQDSKGAMCYAFEPVLFASEPPAHEPTLWIRETRAFKRYPQVEHSCASRQQIDNHIALKTGRQRTGATRPHAQDRQSNQRLDHGIKRARFCCSPSKVDGSDLATDQIQYFESSLELAEPLRYVLVLQVNESRL